MSAARGLPRWCNFNIASRPSRSGASTTTLPVESAGTQQRAIKHFGPIRRGQHDHADVGLEAVHGRQQLIERLFALVVDRSDMHPTLAADGVEFVDEDDAGRLRLGLFKKIAHPRRAHADEHLDELAAADGEERHLGLAGDGPREQRLACARRADQQNAFRNLRAERLGNAPGFSRNRRLPAVRISPLRNRRRHRTSPTYPFPPPAAPCSIRC